MHSTALRQAITLALDVAGMRGPVRRRDVAEQVYRVGEFGDDKLWSLADEREAKIAYLMGAVGDVQSEPLDEADLPDVPRKYRALLSGLPRWICISTSGLHVMTINATPEDWAANARIKTHIAEAVAVKADQSKDVLRLLTMEGVSSIRELGTRRAA